MAADRPLVKQFDKDGNGRLELAERTAAREWMATQPLTGIPAMMDFMSRGMPGGRAGMAKMMARPRARRPRARAGALPWPM